MRPLFAGLSDETARGYGLVLASENIPCRIHPQGPLWALTVHPNHRQSAIRAISLYLKENSKQKFSEHPMLALGAKTYSAFYIIFILALIHWMIIPGYEYQVFVDTFGADAEKIIYGDFYRCITALLFHKDWSHLFNNMVGLALFGTVAASICGWGIGWFMILLSGAIGNFTTAIWYGHRHIAIGASTAVFGALGICVAMSLWRYLRESPLSWRHWLPLASGFALLGFLGTSPHSDLMAHLMGFCFGIAFGGLFGWIIRHPVGVAIQWGFAIAGGGIVAISWVCGVYSNG